MIVAHHIRCAPMTSSQVVSNIALTVSTWGTQIKLRELQGDYDRWKGTLMVMHLRQTPRMGSRLGFNTVDAALVESIKYCIYLQTKSSYHLITLDTAMRQQRAARWAATKS